MGGYILNLKILIVDDEAHITQLIEQTLEDLEEQGVDLLIASDGEEALEVIENKNPQLVFLDVMMPKANGFEVCNTVKNEWKMTDTYIVMLTAKGQEVDKQKGKDVGADMYMTKPFDPDALYNKAVEVLGLS